MREPSVDRFAGIQSAAVTKRAPVVAARLVLPLALVLLTYATPAAADEQRLFALFNEVVNPNSTRSWRISGKRRSSMAGRQRRDARGVPGRIMAQQFDVPNGSMAVTAGGRFVVWRQFDHIGGAERLAMFDRVTGQVSLIVPTLTAGLGVSDPSRPRLFVLYRIQDCERFSGGRYVPPEYRGLFARAISRDGRRPLRDPSCPTRLRLSRVGGAGFDHRPTPGYRALSRVL